MATSESITFSKFKDPNSVLDYQIDWSDWLETGDTISASTWTVPTGLTKGVTSNTTTATLVWLSGGTAGTKYRVVNHITTVGGRQEDRTIEIIVKDL